MFVFGIPNSKKFVFQMFVFGIRTFLIRYFGGGEGARVGVPLGTPLNFFIGFLDRNVLKANTKLLGLHVCNIFSIILFQL